MSDMNDCHRQYLQQARQSIDLIDKKLLQLLTERSVCIDNIAEIKRQKKLTIYDGQRENFIIDKVVQENPTHYHAIDIANIFHAIFRAGLHQQLIYRAQFEEKKVLAADK